MTPPRTPAQIAEAIVTGILSAIGHCYFYGGAPGVSGANCWDCSSCVNYILAYEGLSIPGYPNGSYDGTVHGPSTLSWLAWQGQGVGSIDRTQVQGGDIMCWRTHMGIAISNTEMVSALNPTQGTARTQIDGLIPGETLVPLRLAVIGPGGITLPPITIPGQADYTALTRQQAKYAQDVVWARMRLRNVGKHGLRA